RRRGRRVCSGPADQSGPQWGTCPRGGTCPGWGLAATAGGPASAKPACTGCVPVRWVRRKWEKGSGAAKAPLARLQAQSLSTLDQGAHEAYQLGYLEWLAQEHAVLDAAPVEVERGVGGEKKDAGSARLLVGAQPLVDLSAAQVRQAHVE